MTRQLWLMRHAKSAWPEGVDDYNRPLKKKGRKTALAMGEWMLQENRLPDWLISSPADRARETAERFCKGLQINRHKYLIFDERLYQASLVELKAVLADCPSYKQCVVLIGHNPELDTLLQHLCQESLQLDSEGKILGTAHLAIVNLPNDWQTLPPACGNLVEIIRPKTILDSTESQDETITPAQPDMVSEVMETSDSIPDKQDITPSNPPTTNHLGRLQHWLLRLKRHP